MDLTVDDLDELDPLFDTPEQRKKRIEHHEAKNNAGGLPSWEDIENFDPIHFIGEHVFEIVFTMAIMTVYAFTFKAQLLGHLE